jgi:hypothetical protein
MLVSEPRGDTKGQDALKEPILWTSTNTPIKFGHT